MHDRKIAYRVDIERQDSWLWRWGLDLLGGALAGLILGLAVRYATGGW